jgi:hypothetical protein
MNNPEAERQDHTLLSIFSSLYICILYSASWTVNGLLKVSPLSFIVTPLMIEEWNKMQGKKGNQ